MLRRFYYKAYIEQNRWDFLRANVTIEGKPGI